MAKTLKNLIKSYQKSELSTPNIQIIDKIFLDERIILPDDVLLDLTFSRAFFKKSHLTNIGFYNGSFEMRRDPAMDFLFTLRTCRRPMHSLFLRIRSCWT